ncbi:nitrite reductase small subunit NirD [Rhodococcus sp. P1Y]|uniref:nitrite reductase small subunit NirD n=1 Tax=Rhodococcus sp. P1Y TaxID=1302308 RepID=UPI000EB14916|nr:nitrite reductase small subunit NirD [Rhodococcus sp. P1Y]AYJ49288.1 nitrite reductase (NAD(P)H) small subunit [Rhodococcus sp. P1Y]
MTVIDSRTGTTAHAATTRTAREWTAACTVDSLTPGRGVAVLLRGGVQAALFVLEGGDTYAVGNIDPFGRAAVMSRGLVGDRGGEPTVASPLLKQVFSLVDGRCLDDETVGVGSFQTKVVDGVVFVRGEST